MTTGIMGVFGVDNYGNEASLASLLSAYGQRGQLGNVVVIGDQPEKVRADHHVAATRMWRASGRGAITKARNVAHLAALAWGLDAVVVPGTGILEGLWIQAGGLPLAVFVVAGTMWLRRRPMMLLSIGVDGAGSYLTRRLYAAVLHFASDVTVRDGRSQAAAAALGREVEVRPDLAFALPAPPPASAIPDVVAVGVMDYTGPGAVGDPAQRASYERSMDALVARLREAGHEVLLVGGAAPDMSVARRILARARALPGPSVRMTSARTYPELAAELAGVRVTIASRYHNLLASLAAGTPVVALAYGPKHLALAEEFALPTDFHIADFDPARVTDVATRLAHDGQARARIADRIVTLQGPLADQLARAVATGDAPPTHRPARRVGP